MSRAELSCVIVSLVAIATAARDVVKRVVNEVYTSFAELDKGHAADNEGSYLDCEGLVNFFRLIISKAVERLQKVQSRYQNRIFGS